MFSSEFCEISKNTFNYRTPLVAASVTLRHRKNNHGYKPLPIGTQARNYQGGREVSLPFFENWKKILIFGKKCYLYLWEKAPKFILCVVNDTLLKFPNSTQKNFFLRPWHPRLLPSGFYNMFQDHPSFQLPSLKTNVLAISAFPSLFHHFDWNDMVSIVTYWQINLHKRNKRHFFVSAISLIFCWNINSS